MIQNFRGKNAKDIETAEESCIFSTSFRNMIPESTRTTPKCSVTFQQQYTDNFDNFLEKKK